MTIITLLFITESENLNNVYYNESKHNKKIEEFSEITNTQTIRVENTAQDLYHEMSNSNYEYCRPAHANFN